MENSVQEVTNNELLSIQMDRLPEIDSDPLPSTVYHYTDQRGLLGILESGKLWATDYRYLNDSSELLYTYRLASQLARETLDASHGNLAQRFLQEVGSAPRPDVYVETPYYLCCFSEIDNSLSQWREYGGEQGFSLQFPGDISQMQVMATGQGRQNPGITLLKVVYDQDFHRRYLTALISGLVDLCNSPLMEYQLRQVGEREALAGILPFWWGQQDRVCYRFKHPDFAVENEWRLVIWGSHYTEQFRQGATITPYIQLEIFSFGHPITPGPSGCLPLAAVRHGPSNLPAETKLALGRLLLARGYPEEKCSRLGSTTPARL